MRLTATRQLIGNPAGQLLREKGVAPEGLVEGLAATVPGMLDEGGRVGIEFMVYEGVKG